jgi:hypothetical protein
MNNQVTKAIELLDKKGNITEPGYAVKADKYVYERSKIKANPLRIKEWDFYQLNTDRYMIQIMIFDISIGGAVSFDILDLDTGKKEETTVVDLMTLGKYNLPESAEKPHIIEYNRHDCHLKITVNEGIRHLEFKRGENYCADIILRMLPEHESMVMAVPFMHDGYFYYNQKMNCMTAEGFASANGMNVELVPENSFCVLDWGRGVWPYKVSWFWGNGTTILDDGKLFGFEIGWGFGDMSAASENMLFYDGKANKIGAINLYRNENNIMEPWYFKSDDGRFDMIMNPIRDNYTSSRVAGLIGNICHQVFGNWSGKVVLDDGKTIEIHDFIAFCENSDNRW